MDQPAARNNRPWVTWLKNGRSLSSRSFPKESPSDRAGTLFTPAVWYSTTIAAAPTAGPRARERCVKPLTGEAVPHLNRIANGGTGGGGRKPTYLEASLRPVHRFGGTP